MERDPLLRKLVSKSAEDFVKEQNIEAITEKFLGPVIGAVFLGDWKQMNAFHFCAGVNCLGNGSINADWSSTIDSLTQGFAEKIVIDKVISIEDLNRGEAYQVKCEEHLYRAERVVLSVPGAVDDIKRHADRRDGDQSAATPR